jgi:replicative DNA helicase
LFHGGDEVFDFIGEPIDQRAALDTKTAFLVLCQLNRASTARTDKRPALSDLRDSGGIEQDADCVILLHRDEKAAEDTSSDRLVPETAAIVAKNRFGPTPTIKLTFDGPSQRFYEPQAF